MTGRVIVVGGGLAGLAASVALATRGFKVSLFERSPRLGGRATSYILPDGESIDNCQHVTLGCCTNFDDFFRQIGVDGKIRYYDRLVFADVNGSWFALERWRLPAPFHLGLGAFSTELTRRDRFQIVRALLVILWSGGRPPLSRSVTMLEWLKQHRQTERAIHYFWRTVLISALNEDLDRMDAAYGIMVFWKTFLSNPNGFRVGIPSVPLSDLYAPARQVIEKSGGEVHTRSEVTQINVADGRVQSIRLENGREVTGDHYVAAITSDRLMKMVSVPNLVKLEASPITSVHLWFDRTVMSEPFVAAIGRTVQWVFNKRSGQYLQAVISASHTLQELSQKQVIDLCKDDLSNVIPQTTAATLLRAVVIRENSATFSPLPGSDELRPSQRTPIRNFFIAGDWTKTGWPATMESAVRSGYLAAEAILADAGRSERIVKADLPATGFARWFSGTASRT